MDTIRTAFFAAFGLKDKTNSNLNYRIVLLFASLALWTPLVNLTASPTYEWYGLILFILNFLLLISGSNAAGERFARFIAA